nr:hypothetical protein [uncultured Methanoregula sp.]
MKYTPFYEEVILYPVSINAAISEKKFSDIPPAGPVCAGFCSAARVAGAYLSGTGR